MSNNWFNAGGIALAISIVLFLMGFQAIILGLIAGNADLYAAGE